MSKRESDFYPSRRQDHGPAGKLIENPYDIPGALLDDLKKRGIKPFHVQTQSLAVAGTLNVNVPGMHVVIYGHDGSSIKTVNTTAYAEVQFEEANFNANYPGFPMKHARGFSGPFTQLSLNWPAQTGVFIDIVVFKNASSPWQDGEACT